MGIIGTAAKYAGKGFKAVTGKIGETTIGVGKAGFHKATDKAFQKTAKDKIGDFFENVGDKAMSGAEIGAKMMSGMGDIVATGLDYNPEKYTNSLFGVNLTKPAYKLLVAGGIASGTMGAYNDYNVRQMGTPSGEVVSSMPQINYTRFGEEMGATGDLVFAMNRNRRG